MGVFRFVVYNTLVVSCAYVSSLGGLVCLFLEPGGCGVPLSMVKPLQSRFSGISEFSATVGAGPPGGKGGA